MQAIIQDFAAPLYQQPQRGTLIDQVLFGMTVEVQQCKGEFAQVKTFYGYEGWLPQKSLCQQKIDQWKKAQVFVSTPSLSVLSQPQVQGEILATVPRGGRLILLDEQDGWTQVQLPNGKTGWTMSACLAPCIFCPEKLPEADLRGNLCRWAFSYLGTSYLWGGKTPLGIDCSGLISMVYLLNGIVIYRDATLKDGFGLSPIPIELAKPGDVLYFPGHMAMYLGEGKILHATARRKNPTCCIESIRPEDKAFRPDLVKNILCAGSFFATK